MRSERCMQKVLYVPGDCHPWGGAQCCSEAGLSQPPALCPHARACSHRATIAPSRGSALPCGLTFDSVLCTWFSKDSLLLQSGSGD